MELSLTFPLTVWQRLAVRFSFQNPAGVEIGQSLMNRPGVVSAGPGGINGPLASTQEVDWCTC